MHVELIHPAVRCRMFFLLVLFGSTAVMGQVGGVTVAVTGGYQRQDLRWSIAGNSSGTSPNVYSELKWKGVGMVEEGLDVSWKVWKDWVIVAGGSRASTVGGRVTDMDYGADDRRDVIYDQAFSANKGYAYTLFFGLGYAWRVGPRLVLTPVAGYGLSGQRFSITDGGLLDSYYRTWWNGFGGRFRGEWKIDARWVILFLAGYRQVNYRAEGDWNLIQNFSHPVSFRHRADGYGLEGRLGARYGLGRVVLFVVGDCAGWTTGKGVDDLYLASGRTSQTRLNEVALYESGVSAGVRIGW
ncbi:MAG: hypothetical protein JST42_20915 [Bacteroidetes bacterium]|nr:hypothetical protein [Bacteroidota bacterium]